MSENKGDLISREAALAELSGLCESLEDEDYTSYQALDIVENLPAVDAVELPCKIGDYVWAIRSFNGHKHPQRGGVSDMFFTNDMKLMIVVKYVARGEWGKTVFATDKEAYAAIGERKDGADNGKNDPG